MKNTQTNKAPLYIVPRPHDPFKFDDAIIKEMVDKIVPLIAEPKDYDFFRELLTGYAEDTNTARFASFVNKLLAEHAQLNKKGV